MELRRRIAGIVAFTMIATSVFGNITTVYAVEDIGEIGLYADEIASPEAEHTVDELTASETADVIDVVTDADDISVTGELIGSDAEDGLPVLGDSGVVEKPAAGDKVPKEDRPLITLDDGITYRIDDDTYSASVVSWNGNGKVIIPAVIDLKGTGYVSSWPTGEDDYKRKVVEIEEKAFMEEGEEHRLNELVIEESDSSVKLKIDSEAFSGCTKISSVKFPERMELIGNKAFSGCISLSSVSLPDKLDEFGLSVFEGCTTLSGISIPKNMELKKIELPYDVSSGPFSGAENLKNISFETGITVIPDKLFAACDSVERIDFPSQMTQIGVRSFMNCTNLKTITMEDKITGIGESAFEGTGLTSVDLSSDLKTIGNRAFYNCQSLSSATIPDSVRTIGDSAFRICKTLEKVEFVDGDTGNYIGGEIGPSAFQECESLKEIVIPNSIKKIGNASFYKCINLKEMAIKDRIDYFSEDIVIGDDAFNGCEKLGKVSILSKSVYSIGKSAFYECTALNDVTLSSNNLAIIDNSAFAKCSSLESIHMPDSVTDIGGSVFENCTSLRDVGLSKGLTNVGAAVFRGDTALRAIKLPANIKNVYVSRAEEGIFAGCTYLFDITFEEGITSIAANLLFGTGSIVNLDIPDTVTDIGACAFHSCTRLRKVKIPGKVISIGNDAFNNCGNLVNKADDGSEVILIPDSVKEIGSNAFCGCGALTKMTLPNGLEDIGASAFKDCVGITEIHVPDSVKKLGEGCFEGCSSLTKARLPQNLNIVPKRLFKDCVKLTTVNLSAVDLTTIDEYAFNNCDALVELGGGLGIVDFTAFKVLKEIRKGAFENCDRIAKLKLSAATDTLGEYAFYYCSNLSEIDLGTGLEIIPSYAFATMASLKKMIIPRNVTEIKEYAFDSDASFEEIHIPNTDIKIDPKAFSSCRKLTFYVVKDSPAHEQLVAQGKADNCVFEVVYVDSIDYAEDVIEINRDPNPADPAVEGRKTKPVISILPVHYSVDVKYRSSNPSIFTVDKDGKILGIASGEATLIAEAQANLEGKKARDSVKIVVRVPVNSVNIQEGDATLYVGDKLSYTAVIDPSDATLKDVTWSSDKKDVAYVDSKGTVYAKAEGTARITVTTKDGNRTASRTVTVIKGVDDPPEEWTTLLKKPYFDGYEEKLVHDVLPGTRVKLKHEIAGASIYYTTDGSIPTADFRGRTAGTTKLYSGPIVLNRDTTIRAFAICPGYRYSEDIETTFSVPNGAGDVPGELIKKLFGDDVDRIPSGIWFAFEGDNRYYVRNGSDEIVTTVSREYTGKPITFGGGLYIFDGLDRLVEGRDYSISYQNNTKYGEASSENPPSVTLKGRGNYSGTTVFKFAITRLRIDKAYLLSDVTAEVFIGDELKTVAPTVVYNDSILTAGKDYAVTYYKGAVSETNVVKDTDKAEEGSYIAVISAKDGSAYTGTLKDKIYITAVSKPATAPVQMSSVTVTPDPISVSWSAKGVDVTKLFTVSSGSAAPGKATHGSATLTYGKDFTVDAVDTTLYPNFPSAGTYVIILRGTGNYAGTIPATLKVTGITSDQVKVACFNDKPEYVGRVMKLSDLYKADNTSYKEVTLYTSTGKLTKGTDYDVDMSDAMAYGKFNVVFRLKGNYEGEIVKTVSTKARNMKNDPKLTITPGVAEYSKSGAIPDVFVNYNGLLLKEGVDYTLAYKNNVTISAKKQPTVTVKFKGYFKGSASKAFTVKKAPVTNLTLLLNDVKYSEKKKAKSYKVLPKVYDGLKQVAKKKDIDGFTIKDCTFKNAKTGALIGDTDVLEPGTMIEVTLRVSAASGGMYEGTADIKGTYRVMDPAKLIKTAKIELRKDIEYSGGNELVIKPSDLRVTLKDGYELKSNEFSIVSVTNSRFTGSSKITIRGAGDFGGTKTKSIKVKAAGL